MDSFHLLLAKNSLSLPQPLIGILIPRAFQLERAAIPPALFLCTLAPLLQEVVGNPPTDQRLSRPRRRVELQKGILEVLVDLHDGSLITTSITVVGSREDGDDVPLLGPVETVHDELVCSCDQGETVVVVECFGDVLAERVASTTRRNAPSTAVIWV